MRTESAPRALRLQHRGGAGLLCNRGVGRAGRICSGDRAHDVVGRDDKGRDRPRRGGAQAESEETER